MRSRIEPTLYEDPQTQRRTVYCPVCGGICYWPGYRCIRCGRREP